MAINSSISDLIQTNDLARLHAGAALSCPGACTLQEQAAIVDAMDATGAALEGHLRAVPPGAVHGEGGRAGRLGG